MDDLYRKQGYHVIAGVDEAGRGPLAGPVVAAACILPKNHDIIGIDDSKKLTPKQREELFDQITTQASIHWGIGIISPEIIDDINILQATIQAMLQAVNQLQCSPEILLVDGLKLPHPTIPTEKIVKGDSKVKCIGAASIIAKVTRDRIMIDYDKQFPKYFFGKHKGYGTAMHVEAIRTYGPCPIHRKTFEPIKSFCVTNAE